MESTCDNRPQTAAQRAAAGAGLRSSFEAFNHTTVAIATLCYYMRGGGEGLRARGEGELWVRGGWGVGGAGGGGGGGRGGIGFGGGFLRCSILVRKKNTPGGPPKNAIQLGTAALFLLVYSGASGRLDFHTMTGLGWGLTLLLGVVHTGLAYGIYFGSLTRVLTQTTAILSYVDPVVAVLLSVFVLQEPITELQMAGVCLVLGGMISGGKGNPQIGPYSRLQGSGTMD